MTLEQIKNSVVGSTWRSIAPEVRPSAAKNADGSPKPFYLTRQFAVLPNDEFRLQITQLADPYGKVPLARLLIKGNMLWRGPHPITEGAYKVDFSASIAYEVTPLAKGFADVLNQIAKSGFDLWAVNKMQDILKKAFPPFGLSEGQIFKEYDLICLLGDFMFWGARHVDGRGFDTEENRPTNLQIPLVREK